MQQTFQQFVHDYGFKIEKGMKAHWDKLNKTQELDPNKFIRAIKGKKAFAITDKVIGFVCDQELYITPNTKEALRTLRNNGYKEYAFFVPLSPSDMHLIDDGLAQTWQSIIDKVARRQTAAVFA